MCNVTWTKPRRVKFDKVAATKAGIIRGEKMLLAFSPSLNTYLWNLWMKTFQKHPHNDSLSHSLHCTCIFRATLLQKTGEQTSHFLSKAALEWFTPKVARRHCRPSKHLEMISNVAVKGSSAERSDRVVATLQSRPTETTDVLWSRVPLRVYASSPLPSRPPLAHCTSGADAFDAPQQITHLAFHQYFIKPIQNAAFLSE